VADVTRKQSPPTCGPQVQWQVMLTILSQTGRRTLACSGKCGQQPGRQVPCSTWAMQQRVPLHVQDAWHCSSSPSSCQPLGMHVRLQQGQRLDYCKPDVQHTVMLLYAAGTSLGLHCHLHCVPLSCCPDVVGHAPSLLRKASGSKRPLQLASAAELHSPRRYLVS
jgi:hypothetical protein